MGEEAHMVSIKEILKFGLWILKMATIIVIVSTTYLFVFPGESALATIYVAVVVTHLSGEKNG